MTFNKHLNSNVHVHVHVNRESSTSPSLGDLSNLIIQGIHVHVHVHVVTSLTLPCCALLN